MLSVIKALLNGILSMLQNVFSIILLPINLLFTNLFPDMSNSISQFNNFVTTYVGGTLGFFFSLLPPIFRNLLTVWFTFVVAYYSIYYTYLGIIKIFTLIQKLKFW